MHAQWSIFLVHVVQESPGFPRTPGELRSVACCVLMGMLPQTISKAMCAVFTGDLKFSVVHCTTSFA